jgi:hypothetical protein
MQQQQPQQQEEPAPQLHGPYPTRWYTVRVLQEGWRPLLEVQPAPGEPDEPKCLVTGTGIYEYACDKCQSHCCCHVTAVVLYINEDMAKHAEMIRAHKAKSLAMCRPTLALEPGRARCSDSNEMATRLSPCKGQVGWECETCRLLLCEGHGRWAQIDCPDDQGPMVHLCPLHIDSYPEGQQDDEMVCPHCIAKKASQTALAQPQ